MPPTEIATATTALRTVSHPGGRVLYRPGVLVVDDDYSVRHVVATWLTHFGFPIWSASGGQEAIVLFGQHRADIGIVLLDVLMPDQDGPAVLANLRALDPDVRACFMTGDPGRHSDQCLVELGALAVFAKPLHLANLTDGLTRMAMRESPRKTVGQFPTLAPTALC